MKKFICLLCSLSLCFHLLYAQIEPNLRFRRYGIEEGLSQVTARCLLEDKLEGHVWIGTQDGLNRFDGYGFKIFKHQMDADSSLSSNRIQVLFQDDQSRIWIGTSSGLDLYDRRNESFGHIASNSLSNSNVSSIAQDHSGNIWIGTEHGLNLLDSKQNLIAQFYADIAIKESLSSNKVLSLLVDDSGVVWVGTDNGLNRFNKETSTFTFLKHEPSNPQSLSGNEILTLFQDGQNKIWIGTSKGLNLLDGKNGRLRRFIPNESTSQSLTNSDIRSISQDHLNRIWIGTRWGGINILDPFTNEILEVVNEPDNPNSLSNNTVLSILRDRRDNIWAGVSGMGINIYNPRTSTFKHFKHRANDNNSLLDDEVWSILKDYKNQLWVGTYAGVSILTQHGGIRHLTRRLNDLSTLSSDHVTTIYQDKEQRIWIGTIYGLNLYHPDDDSFTSFQYQEGDNYSLSHNLVRSIFQDRQGRIWVGTEEGGLNLFDPKNKKFKRFGFDGQGSQTTSHSQINCIFQDKNDGIWIGTNQGVNILNPKTGVFRYFLHDLKKPGSLSNNVVRSITEDSAGRIWIGTEGGLNLFNVENETFSNWGENVGLSNNVIYGILIDNQDNLWLSTNKGINKFDPKSEKFTTYDRTDGLQSDEFNTSAYHKDQMGFMYFGGPNGFTMFHPDSIQQSAHIPTIVFTDFLLFNKSVSINRGSILSQSLNHTSAITLQYNDDIFAFEFAALNYEQPEKIQYAYKLEPFHEDWIYTNYTDRKATFTRIPSGNYILHVKASSINGDWNDITKSMVIKVIPPWYQTWWARGVFVVLALLFIILIFKMRERNARLLRQKLQKRVLVRTKQLKAEKEEVSRQLVEKEVLMKEVHHRVKNNLTFLKSLLYLRAKASTDKDVRIILDECQARIETMALVHQVLYDRDITRVDITSFLNELFIQLQAIFSMDSIEIELNVEIGQVPIDMNRSISIGLILNELITNSFKYAFNDDRPGRISIVVSETDGTLILKYSDNGPGLPPDFELEKSNGFGFRLIHILINQINAQFSYTNDDRSTFEFQIPK